MRLVAATLLLVGLATGAQANAGTPLMWLGCFHLFLGNLFIGLFETMIAKRVAPRVAMRPISVLADDDSVSRYGNPRGWRFFGSSPIVAANYLSAIAGMLFLQFAEPLQQLILGARPLEQVTRYIVVAWALTFLLSVALETPFFGLSMNVKPFSKGALRATVIANAASYAVLTLIYSTLSAGSFLTSAKVGRVEEIVKPPHGWVYFVRDGDLLRIRTDGTNQGLVVSGAVGQHEEITTAPGPVEGRARLIAFSASGEEPRTLIDDVGTMMQIGWPPAFQIDARFRYGRFGMMANRSFLDPEQRTYRAQGYYWSWEGLSVTTPRGSYQIALDSPLLSWQWQNATVLPNNQCIAKFGPQIALVDLDTRTVAFLTLGESPTVIMDEPVPRPLPKPKE